MNSRLFVMGSLSALVLGGATVGCAGSGNGIASASSHSATADAKAAAGKAARAAKALGKHDATAAIGWAESAVALAPHDAGYRMLLAQGYMSGGRFQSARATFADVLSLEPNNPRAALNLALAEIACGDWNGARETLSSHANVIPASDRGLALALAGDPAGGVGLLTQVVRSPDSTPKARQNLALALALAGQWGMARAVATVDMSPAEVDKRIEQWAAFAQPTNAYDQVASLLGVHAAADGGQPVALALNAPVETGEPVATVSAAADEAEPATQVASPAASVADAAPEPAAEVAMAEQAEASQPLPVRTLRPESGASKVAIAQTTKPGFARSEAPAAWVPAKGGFFVQLGAFESAGVAKDAWGRATRRLPSLAALGPSGMNFSAKNGTFYRLSVGGFTRGDADKLCRRYRVNGGVCFVRTAAGDQVAQWVPKDVRSRSVQVASR